MALEMANAETKYFTQKLKIMKTIFTLLLSTLFSLSLLAYDGSRLTISSVSTVRMQVEVDGRRYNMNDNEVSIRSLRSGYHSIKIYRDKKQKNRIWDFGFGNGRQEIVYSNSVYLREGYHFDILVNRFGKTFVDEHRIDRNDDWYNNDDNRYGQGSDRDIPDYPENHNNRDNRDNSDNRDQRNDNNYSRAMNDYDFSLTKQSLQKEWFENTRVTTAKQIMDRNYFTSQQAKEILLLFTFENNRLDLAKYAYGKTVDKNNYFIINDVFSFNNSKEELARYIREYR